MYFSKSPKLHDSRTMHRIMQMFPEFQSPSGASKRFKIENKMYRQMCAFPNLQSSCRNIWSAETSMHLNSTLSVMAGKEIA